MEESVHCIAPGKMARLREIYSCIFEKKSITIVHLFFGTSRSLTFFIDHCLVNVVGSTVCKYTDSPPISTKQDALIVTIIGRAINMKAIQTESVKRPSSQKK